MTTSVFRSEVFLSLVKGLYFKMVDFIEINSCGKIKGSIGKSLLDPSLMGSKTPFKMFWSHRKTVK